MAPGLQSIDGSYEGPSKGGEVVLGEVGVVQCRPESLRVGQALLYTGDVVPLDEVGLGVHEYEIAVLVHFYYKVQSYIV